MDNSFSVLMAELVELQKQKVLRCGRQFVPHLTADDVLQPNDFPLLENNPHFRYEEGILAGLQSAQTAIFTYMKEKP